MCSEFHEDIELVSGTQCNAISILLELTDFHKGSSTESKQTILYLYNEVCRKKSLSKRTFNDFEISFLFNLHF